MKIISIKNDMVRNGLKPFQMENENVGNGLKPFPTGNQINAILLYDDIIVGNGLKPFPTGKIVIETNKNHYRFPDIRNMVSIGTGAKKEKFKIYNKEIDMKTITNQILIWAKQQNLSFWK